MKTSRFLATILAFILLPFTLLAAGKRDAMWKAVEAAADDGLPKTAIERLAPIIAAALKDKAYPEAIKAIARRIALEGEIEGSKPEEKITRMEAEIAKAPKEMVPVMQVILADWYWQYFQQNRQRFFQRTAVGIPGLELPEIEAPGSEPAGAPAAADAKPGAEFTTWDLPRLLAEIDRQFSKALSAEAELKKIPIASFGDLLEKGGVPDSHRPTLFDFVAHEALTFYSAGEQAASKEEDAFEIAADGPVFGTMEEFLKWDAGGARDGAPPVPAATPDAKPDQGGAARGAPLPGTPPLPRERCGQVRASALRSGTAALRAQSRVRRDEGRALQGRAETFRRAVGRPRAVRVGAF